MLKFKDFAGTPKRSFWAQLNRFLYHLYNLLCTSPGSSRMAETVIGFLIKVNRSPIRLKLTDPVLDDWFMKFSIYFEKCMKLLWNLLDRATLKIIFHTEDTVMELLIWYSFLSNPFKWHVLKFKLHWYNILIRVTKNVRGPVFLEHPLHTVPFFTTSVKSPDLAVDDWMMETIWPWVRELTRIRLILITLSPSSKQGLAVAA